MRVLYFLLLAIMTACPAWAGPSAKRMLSVIGSYGYVTSINGISSLSSSGTMDTGTQTFTLTANPITVVASCSSSSVGVQSDVTLAVDGVDRDYIICDNNNVSRTLTYTPAAGVGTVRVYATTDNPATGTATAGSFRIPGTP